MAGCAGNVAVTRQDRVEKQQLANFRLLRVELHEIRGLQHRRKRVPIHGRARERDKNGDHMRLATLAFCLLTTPALAEIETARDLMDAKEYAAAMQELLPAARSGNAEA